MKTVKTLAVLLVLSCFFALGNVNAGYRTYGRIKLSNWSGIYIDGPISKTTTSSQSVHTIDARDTLSNDVRAISARTVGEGSKYSSWISAPKGVVAYWDRTTNGGNTAKGAYNIQLKATKSTITGTYYWGTWSLDN